MIHHILKFDFIGADEAAVQKPQCVVCGDVLSNDSMKPSNLKRHWHSKHKDYSSKPKKFFERKRSELKSAQKQMYSLTQVNTKALRASYKVALRIAKAQKSYSVGETLVKGCIQDVCLEVLDEAATAKAAKVSLSNDTIARRTADLAENMKIQLVDQIKLAKHYSLQLDERTDIGNMAILMVYVRYKYEGKLKEEFFFSAALPRGTTGAEISKTIFDYIENKGLDMKNCVGVCSDGAAAMIGKKSGVFTRIKQLAPECASTHCFIHRESLATKKLSTKLNDVFCEVVKIVNYIKGSAVNSRLFALLCDDMPADHRQLIFYSSVRWLSRGKVLSRVYELRNKPVVFLHHRKPD